MDIRRSGEFYLGEVTQSLAVAAGVTWQAIYRRMRMASFAGYSIRRINKRIILLTPLRISSSGKTTTSLSGKTPEEFYTQSQKDFRFRMNHRAKMLFEASQMAAKETGNTFDLNEQWESMSAQRKTYYLKTAKFFFRKMRLGFKP